LDRAELEKARDALAAGNVPLARRITSSLGAEVMPRRVPRCAWVAKLLSGPEPRLEDARREPRAGSAWPPSPVAPGSPSV
jgi:hypothetical protein